MFKLPLISYEMAYFDSSGVQNTLLLCKFEGLDPYEFTQVQNAVVVNACSILGLDPYEFTPVQNQI